MSQNTSVTISCPRCGHRQAATMWASINVSIDAHLKPRILNDELMSVVCEACHNVSVLQYSFLYHDMRIPAAIWLVRPSDESVEMSKAQTNFARTVSADYRLRVVRSMQAMIEAILIFDAALNDLAVQILKFHFLENTDKQTLGPWYFSGISVERSETRMLFEAPSSKQGASMPFPPAYSKLTAELDRVTPERVWLEATPKNAVQLLGSAL